MSTATPVNDFHAGSGKPQHLAAMLGGMLVVAAAALYVWFTGGRSLSADVDAIRRFVGRARVAALAAFSGTTADTASHSTSALSAARCGHRKVSR
ncbi:hypothetical protein [Nevskia soli]|uniref:hypothetical protein n=1 Tax=Nevskia soli TaxID=418856 RepID=UPI0004A74E51|nr:hypothetical protein [Nevskia soli]